MSVAIETNHTPRYGRASSALWRDTGRHVVAHGGLPGGRVHVLGGGGALLWRMLEQSATLAEILDALTAAGGSVPPNDEVAGCLDALVACGLLLVDDEEEMPS